MKFTLLSLLISLSFSQELFSQENINLVVTQQDGNPETIVIRNDELQTFKAQHPSSLIETDVIVGTPKKQPLKYASWISPLKLDERKTSVRDYYAKPANNPDYLPNDKYFDQQTYWQAPDEQFLSYNNILASVRQVTPLRRLVVGIVDSGFYKHPDLNYVDGYSFTQVSNSVRGEDFYLPEEFNGSPLDRELKCGIHGTGVAGVSTAIRDNFIGFTGVADADLIVARSLYCGLGYLNDTSDGMLWQLGEPLDGIRPATITADVINLSLGGQNDTCVFYMQNAIDKANSKGVPVVAAIGNASIDATGFTPSNCENLINVAAASRDGDLFKTSNFGSQIHIAAYGDGVAGVTGDPEQVGYWDESSFAAPIVTGVIANALSEFDALSIDEIKFFMSVTATPFVTGQCDDSMRCGPGILDAEKFHLGLRDYKSGDLLSFKPALNNTQFCDKTLYATDDAELARLCNTVELILPNHQSNRSDIRFELLSFDKGTDMSFDNASIVTTTQSSRLLLGSLNLSAFDYGIRMCNSERCYGNSAIKITDLSNSSPAICN
jgi:hypothetical protein